MSEVVPGLNTRNWRSRVEGMASKREHKTHPRAACRSGQWKESVRVRWRLTSLQQPTQRKPPQNCEKKLRGYQRAKDEERERIVKNEMG
jgi:hypothetical protein